MKFLSGESYQPEGWVPVASAPNRIAAGVPQGLLEGAGIPVMTQGPPVPAYFGAGGAYRLLVPADRKSEAREVLEGVWPLEEESDE